MNIEINVKLTKPLTDLQAQALTQLDETEKFLYLMAIRQEIFEGLDLDNIDLDKSVEVEFK